MKKSNAENTKRWVVVFRALANANRLKIIGMLADGGRKNVSEIAGILRISLKAVSNHLVILKNLDVLEAEGSAGHVWYWLNPQLPEDFHKAASLFLP